METTQKQPALEQFIEDEEGGLQLGQIVDALKRRFLLIAGVTTIITAGAVLRALTDTPIYQAQFEILTQESTLETRIISTANPDGLSRQDDLISSRLTDVRLQILRSPRLLEPILEKLQVRYPSLSYRALYSGISLRVESGQILVVRFTNENKNLVEDVLAQLAEDYISYSVNDRQSGISRGVVFVEEQLPRLQERVDFLQDSLQDLRQTYNLLNPTVQGEQLTQQIYQFQQEQLQINIQLQESRQVYAALQQEVASNGVNAVSSSLQGDPRYQQLLSRLLELDTQIAQQSVLLLETSPEIQYLLEQKQSLVPVLEQESRRVQRQLGSLIQELSARNQILNAAVEDLNSQVKELSAVTLLYNDIERELGIATGNLNEFLSQREVLRIEAAQEQAPWEILTQPSSPRASVASAQQNLVLGGILGLILGSGVALAVDKLSSLIRTSGEAQSELPFPLLGSIPWVQSLEDEGVSVIGSGMLDTLLPANDVSTEKKTVGMRAFSEAFRSLSTNLRLMTPDKAIHALTVSSASPNEGKTTVCVHLAQALAAMGLKVLLVDTDLRRPWLHRQLGLSNEYGLMDIIASSSNIELKAVVQPSLLSPNLFVLTSGNVPPDPPTVLASSTMSSFHQEARKEFDFILYDSPPMLGFADTYLTAALTQNLLIVVGISRVKRSQLQQLSKNLKVPDIKVLGTVVNGVPQTDLTTYSYYDYYSQKTANNA